LGSKHYSRAIDVWAVGCILGELVLRRALFPGKEEKHLEFKEDQLRQIFLVLGKPTLQQWPTLEACGMYNKIRTWEASSFPTSAAEVRKRCVFVFLVVRLPSQCLVFHHMFHVVGSASQIRSSLGAKQS
jgi:serine/threonine protein kinase